MTIEVSIEEITAQQAEQHLQRNFKNNRKISGNAVRDLKRSIVDGQFFTSADAITFDTEGRLVNGQHRMTAVRESGLSAQFLVIRNFPAEHVSCIDIGRKRSMNERLTIAGVDISAQHCAVVRNAMTDYESNAVGTIRYSKLRHDEQVADWYRTMRMYLDLCTELKWQKPGFFVIGAMFITQHLEHQYIRNRRQLEVIGQEPGVHVNVPSIVRGLQFLEYANTGEMERTGVYLRETDQSVKTMYEAYIKNKAKGRYWNAFEQLNWTLCLANSFARFKGISKVNTTENNPFVGAGRTFADYGLALDDAFLHCWDSQRNQVFKHLDPSIIDAIKVAYKVE